MSLNSRELILGQIPDNFNPQKHIPLGPFCFADKEKIYKNWTNLQLEDDPFSSLEDLKIAEKKCTDYGFYLLKGKTIFFNKKLNLNFSDKFWKIILFPWLTYFIQTTYERQIRLHVFINKFEDEKIHVKLVKDNIVWNFNNCLEYYYNGIQNSIYNEWIFSRILENILPKNWTFEYNDRSTLYPQTLITKRQNRFKNYLKNFYLFKFKSGFSRVYGVYGFIFLDYILFNLVLFFRKPKNKYLHNNIINYFDNNKFANCDINWDFDFNLIFEKVIPKFILDLPIRINKFKKEKYSFNKVNLISAAEIYHEDNDLKIKLALRYEYGEKLISVQHGGHNYGTSKFNSLANIVEYNQYAFITWGWKEQEDYKGNFIPLPNPYLSKFTNKYRKNNNINILVGNYMNYFFISFRGSPQSKQQLKYRDGKLVLLNNLNPDVKENLFYRPYPHLFHGYSDAEYCKDIYPELKIIYDYKDFHKQMWHCNLLILDHPGTTLIMALVANIPLICFWKKEHYPLSHQNENLLNEFIKFGIFHTDPEKAAKKINEVYNSTKDWWSDENIQKVRLDFLNVHGLTDKYWRKKWINYLRSI